jgi:hypothetical protein
MNGGIHPSSLDEYAQNIFKIMCPDVQVKDILEDEFMSKNKGLLMNLQNIGILQELTFIYKYSLNGLKGTID